MNSEEQIYDEIDLYLKGKLEGEKLRRFEEKLQTDADFSQTVKVQKVAYRIIKTKQLAALRERINSDLKKDLPGNSIFRNVLIAAAMLGMTASVFYVFNETGNKSEIEKKSVVENAMPGIEKKNREDERKEEQQKKCIEVEVAPQRKQEPERFTNDSSKAIEPLVEEKKREFMDTIVKKEGLEKPALPVNTDPCKNILIQASADVNPTCKGKEEGSIMIHLPNIKGGTSPYTFSIDGGNTYSANLVYPGLKGGSYKVLIKDKNNCKGYFPAKVEEKICQAIVEDVFNPNYGNWKIPAEEYKEAEIKIVNKSGVLVYSKHIQGGISEEWDGRDLNGQLLEKGLYLFHIVYKDGSQQKGYISIMY